ncbi:uncharacterized protein F5Z01DRAFT_752645 [Emericellopsis atlantica]|uniref:DUF7730 domain-containing protein n=1 Tax=Emericellopsis atlantica TaxID=2614577 RepID=A0A9P7ZG58_9HYPO|nr:uncharacterized protein F5Z01DRAFT_752645 [Emericellopsis atlantica]KAG9251513.1 hypothetical protein F5Z01DRAFT_752645 [Emericellopsis atlantica]
MSAHVQSTERQSPAINQQKIIYQTSPNLKDIFSSTSKTSDSFQTPIMNNAFMPWAAPPPGLFPFLRLPPEVRTLIYEHAFVLNIHIELAIRDENAPRLSALTPYKCQCAQHADERMAPLPRHFLALLETCTLIKREAAPILYGKNVFCFGDGLMWEPDYLFIAHRSLQRIGATNLNFIKAIGLHVDALPNVIARDYTAPPGVWPAWRIPAPYPQGELVRYIAAMCPRIDTIYLGDIGRLKTWDKEHGAHIASVRGHDEMAQVVWEFHPHRHRLLRATSTRSQSEPPQPRRLACL